MLLTNFYAELKRRNVVLTYAGLTCFIVFLIILPLSLVDSRTVLGINTWIKPMKFLISVGIYVWTIGWILENLNISKINKNFISWTLATLMTLEMVVIVMQGARGVRSHFNFNTFFDAMAFASMGVIILLNTLLILYVLYLFFTWPAPMSQAYLWALRLGIILFLFASYEGSLMIDHEAHSVGVADGGAGLPFLNWSTEGGDLRVAHFVGLHALQILPLFAFYLEKRQVNNTFTWVCLLALGYAGLALLVFLQAQAGIPLVAGS